MDRLSSISVSLTSDLDGFVKERVANGHYATSSDVVREGLRLLQQRERETDAAVSALKVKLQRASEQADRGELIDGEAVFSKIEAAIQRRRGTQQP